jgi:Flp pilus assembly protein TadD
MSNPFSLFPRQFAVPCLILLAGFASGCGLARVQLQRDALAPEEHRALAQAYEAQGFRDLAAAEYRSALQGRRNDSAAWFALGNLEFYSGRMKAAEKCYRRVLKLSAGHPGAANNLAMTHLRRGKNLREARRLVLSALENPGPYRPYLLDTLAQLGSASPR